ncbi:DUF3846 domain-containing protein [Moritella viscosa]|uniref:DUF3846 domain-containing protein n=1 Tax=Moritella viscosa TaxID=80854 RepID=UPI0005091C5B|nr:DUF3846 domain-containing protein [Moritella viscosa]CED59820.1 putative uncharacterized phage protein [Moritella viscosa]SGY90279.1 Probable two-component sensor protein [Moritella viscosa]SHO03437.1 Probable two-component sensor protein [Moritella viscosa]
MNFIIKWELKGTAEVGYVLNKTYEELHGNDVLSELQRLVDGRIEVITYIDGAVLLMNEEAVINGMPVWAVKEDHELNRYVPEHFVINDQKVLVGPVVMCSDDGIEFSGFKSIEECKEVLRNK